MFILLASALSNVVMDVWFVAGLGLGSSRRCLGTIIAQAVGAFYALYCVYRRREQLGFDFRLASFRIHGPTLKVILKLGTPLVIMSASITASMMVVTSFVNTFGVSASAITGIGAKLNSLVSVVTSSMQTAVGSMVAQNFAARRIDRVKKVNAVSNLVCILFFVVVGTVSYFFPVQIIGIFTQATDTGVLAWPPHTCGRLSGHQAEGQIQPESRPHVGVAQGPGGVGAGPLAHVLVHVDPAGGRSPPG